MKMDKKEINAQTPKKHFEIGGMRYLFAASGFLGFCVIYAIRVNINVAIVAMVNATAVYDHRNSSNENSSTECSASDTPFDTNGTSYEPQKEGEFIWSPKMQGVVIGAFYYGYCISQIPGGRLAEVTSGKWVFGFGVLITAVLTLLTPIAAKWNVGVLIMIRAIEGLAQGVTMPAMHSMLGKWLPDGEKSSLSSAVYVGVNVGTVAAMPLVGILCNSDFLGGWPSAFYVIGIVGCLWFVLWCFLVTETPAEHPFISSKELNYILSNQKIDLNKQLPPIPWKKILSSLPVWALIITQIGQDWCFYTLVNDLPTYFATILHFQITKSGFLTSFPHLLQSIVGVIVGFGADGLIRKKTFRTGFIRKFCNSIAGISSCLGLVGICLAGCDATITIICYMCLMGFGGFCYSGYIVNLLELSPEYAGTLIGLANTISNLAGFAAPLVVGIFTDQYQTLHQWRYVFSITAIFIAISTIVFLFSSSDRQEWIAQESYCIIETVRESSLSEEKSVQIT